jgi:hypothetical protein
MGLEWSWINNGPLSGFAPPGSCGLDLATPQIQMAGANGIITGNGGGLAGVGAQLTAATSITVTNKVHHVVGTTAIQTIVLPAGAAKGTTVTLIPDSASGQTTITGGNIALGSTLIQNKALILTWDGTSFYPSY